MPPSRQLHLNADCTEEVVAAIGDDTTSLLACQLAHPVFTKAARHRLFARTTVRALTETQSFCRRLSWLKFNPHVASRIRTPTPDGTLESSLSWTRGEVDSCTANEFFLACQNADTILFRNLRWAPCTYHNEPLCPPGLQDSLTRLTVAFDNIVVQLAEWDLEMVPQYSRHCDTVSISHTSWEMYEAPVVDPAALHVRFPPWSLHKLSVSGILPIDSWRLRGLLLASAECMTELAIGISMNHPVLGHDAFDDTVLAVCPIYTLSLSIPFYMATTDVAVEECNELLRCLLRQICATNLSDLHICIDVGTESMTRARVLLGAVGWLFVYSHLTTLHNLSVFTVELVGHRLTAADIDTMRGAIPIAPIDALHLNFSCAPQPALASAIV